MSQFIYLANIANVVYVWALFNFLCYHFVHVCSIWYLLAATAFLILRRIGSEWNNFNIEQKMGSERWRCKAGKGKGK